EIGCGQCHVSSFFFCRRRSAPSRAGAIPLRETRPLKMCPAQGAWRIRAPAVRTQVACRRPEAWCRAAGALRGEARQVADRAPAWGVGWGFRILSEVARRLGDYLAVAVHRTWWTRFWMSLTPIGIFNRAIPLSSRLWWVTRRSLLRGDWPLDPGTSTDRKSTRLNSSHVKIS